MINIILTAIILPAISHYRTAALESACRSNLKALGYAEEAIRAEKLTYIAVDDWHKTGKEILDYIQGGSADKVRCPQTGINYIIAPVTDIRNSYKIICRTLNHHWQVRTGATFIRY